MMMQTIALRSRGLLAGAALSALVFTGAPAWADTPPDTLVQAWAIDDIISLDPAEAFELSTGEITGNTYDMLVRLDVNDTTKVVGGIAESWTVSDDGLTYTFKLKPGLKFASGNPISAEDDADVAPGESGELILRASEPFAFATGYHGMAEKTVEAWRNLWFHTGDRVSRDGDGNYRFIDRMKDAIRRRGENISSWEVEQVLLSHPAVASCAVYAVPSELGEDEVMAAILPEAGQVMDPAELLDFCSARLAYFAVPRFIDFVTELPLTENGKIRKVVLRQAGITGTAWDREAAGYRLKR